MSAEDDEEIGFLDLLQHVMSNYSFPIDAGHISMKNRVRHQVKRRRADIKRVRRNLDPKVERVRQKASQQFDKMERAFAKAVVANQTEKIWYTLTLSNILFMGMAIAARPQIMHIIYTCELSFSIPIRFWMYHRRNWHYFLADLCYYVNGLLMLYIWVWPQWQALWISCFAFSYGTLAGSVILWRNSSVLQSIDKTTSSFIHLMPPVVTYCIHFRLDHDFKTQRFPGAYHTNTWNIVHSVSITTLAYFVWQFAYHYFITVRKADKIRRGTVTSFEFMRHRYGKTWLGKFVNSLPGPLPVMAFMMIQFTFQMVTMAPCPLYYMHEPLSIISLITIFSVAAFNGASYYIEVYGQRFHKQLTELQAEFARLDEDTRDDDNEEDDNGDNDDSDHDDDNDENEDEQDNKDDSKDNSKDDGKDSGKNDDSEPGSRKNGGRTTADSKTEKDENSRKRIEADEQKVKKVQQKRRAHIKI